MIKTRRFKDKQWLEAVSQPEDVESINVQIGNLNVYVLPASYTDIHIIVRDKYNNKLLDTVFTNEESEEHI